MGMSWEDVQANKKKNPLIKAVGGPSAAVGVAGAVSKAGSAAIRTIRTGGIKVPNPFTSRTIAHETSSGQLAMFKPSQVVPRSAQPVIGRGIGGRVSNPSPPFKGGSVSRPAPKERVKSAARSAEKNELRKKKVAQLREELARERRRKNSRLIRENPPKTAQDRYIDDLFGV